MKKNIYYSGSFILVAMCFITLAFAQDKGLAPAHFEDSITLDGKTCSLKLKKSFVTLLNNFGEKLEFSVYCDGKFLHPSINEGGILIGCHFPYTTPKSKNPIEKLVLSGKQRGWLINTLEGCGNISYNTTAVVLPNPNENNYFMKKYASDYFKPLPRSHGNSNSIEVWYAKTVSCDHKASSTSISFALLDVINGDAKLPNNFQEWPEALRPDYSGAFLAGMANKNSAVLESAKKLLNEPLEEGTCLPEGVPRSQKQLDEIIQAMKTFEKNKVMQYF